ncbi:hypothetical protein DL767_009235 [Monosporascus sp. MG133]|nr:hypothetical protein DL767_009235 [Monosporascus sp. MG133]
MATKQVIGTIIIIIIIIITRTTITNTNNNNRATAARIRKARAARAAAASAAATADAAATAASAAPEPEPEPEVSPAPAPSVTSAVPATPARPPRVRPARGACRTVPYLGCLRSAFAGRSTGECFAAAVGSRYWRYASGHTCTQIPAVTRSAAARLMEVFENDALCRICTLTYPPSCAL